MNIDTLMLKQGPGLVEWRRRVAASVGAVLIQDLPPDARALLAELGLEVPLQELSTAAA